MGGEVSVLGRYLQLWGTLAGDVHRKKKKRTDDIFKDGLCIHNFTAMVLLERVMDIVDLQCPLHKVPVMRQVTMTQKKAQESEKLVVISMPEAEWRIAWSQCCRLNSCALQHHLQRGCPHSNKITSTQMHCYHFVFYLLLFLLLFLIE